METSRDMSNVGDVYIRPNVSQSVHFTVPSLDVTNNRGCCTRQSVTKTSPPMLLYTMMQKNIRN